MRNGINTPNIYLDHSASTPTDPKVIEAMLPYFYDNFGNSSSMHAYGRRAEGAVEEARERVAAVFHCKPQEIIFTSGGSESDNLALRGTASASNWPAGSRLLTTPIEHEAVQETLEELSIQHDYELIKLPLDRDGHLSLADFATVCDEKTVLASIIYASNEIGSVQPISELAHISRERGCLFHTDAVQAAGQLPLDVTHLNVDLMSIAAHKFYGPKGVGALFCHEGIPLHAHLTGGAHEGGRRAGTLNTPGIVGLALALELAEERREIHNQNLTSMRDRLISGILSEIPGARLSGHSSDRLPSHASFTFAGLDAQTLLMHLDLKGIAASSGSACKTGQAEPSPVLISLGYDAERARSGLRLTVGRSTTTSDIDYTIKSLQEIASQFVKPGFRS